LSGRPLFFQLTSSLKGAQIGFAVVRRVPTRGGQMAEA
jgi:hypothetical protein